MAACILLSSASLATDTRHVHHNDMELGISLSAAKISHDKTLLTGLHLHLSHHLAESGFLSVCSALIGVETLLGGAPHTALTIGIQINPWKGLSLAMAPGILWAKEVEVTETRFSLHLEAAYGFELGEIDLGPVVEFAFAGEDRHYAVGIHMGYGF